MKKIRYKKLKAAVRKMEHRHGLRSSSDEDDSDMESGEDEMEDSDDDKKEEA